MGVHVGEIEAGQLHSDPDLFVRIAENALVVAEDLRDDYFKSTLGMARAMRGEFRANLGPYRIRPVDQTLAPPCSVAFVDGGLSKVDVGLAVPLIVRAGIFRVKQGERNLEKRETFDHFPLMLGQLKGGLKADSKYGDVVRQLMELGALVTALEDERFNDIRVLMLHGPLQFVAGPFFEHWFDPSDYALMLGRDEREHVLPVLRKFSEWCVACPQRGSAQCGEDIRGGRLPAVCVMAFLQHYIFARAADKDVLVCGVVERSFGRSITKYVVHQMLEAHPDVFDRLLTSLGLRGGPTTTQVDAIMDATRYNDAVLLALALEAGEYLEWYPVNSHLKIKNERVDLFPSVQTTFVRPAASRYPMRIEVPAEYGAAQCDEVLRRSFEYAGMLPNYAFPIGLDIVDKYAAIPAWMTKAYRQLILAQYGRLLAGEYFEMTDTEAIKAMLMSDGHGRRSRVERPGV